MSEFFRLCLLHLIKSAHPMQLQSLCWNDVLCNYSQRSQFLGLRMDFVPVHLCLRADFRLCARAQEGARCQLVQSAADCRPSRVVRVTLVAPLPQPQTPCLVERRAEGQRLCPASSPLGRWVKQGLLLQLRPCRNDCQVYSILRLCFLASHGWFSWFNTWPLIQ